MGFEPDPAAERERIASRLQDVVAGRLSAVSRRLDAIMPFTADADVQRRIGDAAAELNTIIADVRTTILDLQRGDGDTGSVEGRVRPLALNAGQQLGCTPRLVFEGPLDTLDAALVAELTAVADESLTNLVRHAYAGTIDLSVVRADGALTLEVRDDGVGPNDEPTSGKGLADLLLRAEALGGTCTVEPNLPMGTTLRWSVPI
ncbi:MAG: ATP-binding protein [Jatrophihabitantaceae bacterium]